MSRRACHDLLAIVLPTIYTTNSSGVYIQRYRELIVPSSTVGL